MSRGKKRIDADKVDRSGDTGAFAVLKQFGTGRAPSRESPPSPKESGNQSGSKPAFQVEKSRKGNWPLAIEKRPGNKVVTVITKVKGDREALLKALKKQCGAGGALRPDGVEIQGDQRDKVEAFLEERLG